MQIFIIQDSRIYSGIICFDLPDSTAYTSISSISEYPLNERQLNPWICSFVGLYLVSRNWNTTVLQAKSAPLLVFANELYWNRVIPIYFHFVYVPSHCRGSDE